MLSDAHFIYGMYVTILTQYSKSDAPTYLYRMSVESELNILKKVLKIEVPGMTILVHFQYNHSNF